MKKKLIILLALFVIACEKPRGLEIDELAEAANYAIDVAMYWNVPWDFPPEITQAIKKNLGKSVPIKLYSRKSGEVRNRNEYFLVFPEFKIKANNAVLRIQIWPRKIKGYVSDTNISQEGVNEFRGYVVQDQSIVLTEMWKENVARFDAEYEKARPQLESSFKKYFSEKGLKGVQELYVGPFSKWSTGVIVYWKNKNTFYNLHCYDFDSITFNACVENYGHGIKGKDKISPWVKNCVEDGKALEINVP